ncbi:MAG: hypothetical protein PHN83_07645, partial [Dysgonamonadaceae bacterium]|nr:hypothetical protein [Dysgonamonadaceae bacterium]
MKGSANGTNICFVFKSSFPMVPLPHDRKNKASSEKYLKCISNLDFVVDVSGYILISMALELPYNAFPTPNIVFPFLLLSQDIVQPNYRARFCRHSDCTIPISCFLPALQFFILPC